jgi:hypothetical protein
MEWGWVGRRCGWYGRLGHGCQCGGNGLLDLCVRVGGGRAGATCQEKQEQAKGQREKRTFFHPKIITEKPRQFPTGLFLSILFF